MCVWEGKRSGWRSIWRGAAKQLASSCEHSLEARGAPVASVGGSLHSAERQTQTDPSFIKRFQRKGRKKEVASDLEVYFFLNFLCQLGL